MIKLTGVGKVYNPKTPTEVQALRDVNLEISRGDFVAITGPSGSGKSTLLHILAGLDTVTSGHYFFCENDVSTMSDREKCKMRNEKIAIILQSFGLIGNETVINNVVLPQIIGGTYHKKLKSKVYRILKQVGLTQVSNTPVNQLSGGQRQRVAIARALAMDADVLLADEPTGALDQQNTESLVQLLTELNQNGLTIVIVTHNNSVAEKCPIAYSIKDGFLSRNR
jgi:putative ABC transport system ATP-binding protein